MGWTIKCNNPSCGKTSWANNIVDLIKEHRDSHGWFICDTCKGQGHIDKSFDLQEPGSIWEPFLRGAIPLGAPSDTYQPFVFLVSYEANGPSTDIWFSYYKDLRSLNGGRLKLGYGPGGPPVLNKDKFLDLIKRLIEIGYVSKDALISLTK